MAKIHKKKGMCIMYQDRIWKVSALLVFVCFALFMCLAAGCSSKSNTVTGASTNKITIQGEAFSPNSLTVSAGTIVTWTNMDSFAHSVNSGTPDSPTSLFNSGNIAANGTFSYTFNTKGTYPYYCSIHTFMTGTVVVQ
jgi:plastocyanin